MPHECVEEIDIPLIVVVERGRKAVFSNVSRAIHRRVKVDGCLINEGSRADWIITKLGVGSVIVELKGKDLDNACRQLMVTSCHGLCEPWMETRRALLIVCSRYPSFDTAIAKAKVAARKRGMRLTVVCSQSKSSVEELVGI